MTYLYNGPCGVMDKASACEATGCRFKSRCSQLPFFIEKTQVCKLICLRTENDFLDIAKFHKKYFEIWLCSKSHFPYLWFCIFDTLNFDKKYFPQNLEYQKCQITSFFYTRPHLMSKKSFSVLRQINLDTCVISMKKGNWLHLDLNLQPVVSQADALFITPQSPLYKSVKINNI